MTRGYKSSSGLVISPRIARASWMQIIVVRMSEWPSNSCTLRISTHRSTKCVANECRSVCAVTRFSSPAAFPAAASAANLSSLRSRLRTPLRYVLRLALRLPKFESLPTSSLIRHP